MRKHDYDIQKVYFFFFAMFFFFFNVVVILCCNQQRFSETCYLDNIKLLSHLTSNYKLGQLQLSSYNNFGAHSDQDIVPLYKYELNMVSKVVDVQTICCKVDAVPCKKQDFLTVYVVNWHFLRHPIRCKECCNYLGLLAHNY